MFKVKYLHVCFNSYPDPLEDGVACIKFLVKISAICHTLKHSLEGRKVTNQVNQCNKL